MLKLARVNLTLPLVLLAFGWSVCATSFASSVITSDSWLKRNGLPLDAAVLTGYLTNGIPHDLAPPKEENADFVAKAPFKRWTLYQTIVAYLGETDAKEVAPATIKLIADELPEPLEHDLDVHVVGYSGHNTEGESDFARQVETATFRAACANALARMNDQSALPILTDYLDSLKVEVDVELEKENPDSAYLWAFSRTCVAIAALGANDGIQATIERLDKCPIAAPETLINYLRVATGQSFGPEYDQPLHTRPAEIEKWKTWWMANKDSYRANRARLLEPQEAGPPPGPPPSSLQQYVAAAESRYFDYSGTGHGKAAVTWLEANGARNTDGLRGIISDGNEPSRVRGEALAWYAKFAGEDAYDLLRELATSDQQFELHIESIHLQSKALKLLDEMFPKRVEEVARDILTKGGLAVGVLGDNAVYIFARNPENLHDLAENFDSVDVKPQVIQFLVNANQLISSDVFSKAIQGDDMHVAAFGYEGARKWNLLDSLDADTTVALERWKSNPVFLAILFNREQYDGSALEFCRETLRGISGTGVEEAKAYRNLYVSLGSSRKCQLELKNEPESTDTLITEAWDGFSRCVEAYRATREQDSA